MSKVVMVVDDSESIRKFIMFALRGLGYNVITAKDGMDALEKLPQANPNLIITDLNMPNLDGFGLVKTIREDQQYAGIPVIILSSLSDERDIELGMKLGADAYLVKPFQQKRLQYEVTKFIN